MNIRNIMRKFNIFATSHQYKFFYSRFPDDIKCDIVIIYPEDEDVYLNKNIIKYFKNKNIKILSSANVLSDNTCFLDKYYDYDGIVFILNKNTISKKKKDLIAQILFMYFEQALELV